MDGEIDTDASKLVLHDQGRVITDFKDPRRETLSDSDEGVN